MNMNLLTLFVALIGLVGVGMWAIRKARNYAG